MGLRDIELTLPPGFRFYPSDEELVCHYLHNKVVNERFAGGGAGGTMVEVDLHTHEPWELPDVAKLSTNEWYFFSFRDRKYATGLRTNRATKSGYWKATGKDRIIHNPKLAAGGRGGGGGGRHAVVGMRKTLVFYRGRAPNGIKSSWVMHEFRMENPHTPPKEDWVLCRVFHKKKADSMDQYAMDSEQEVAVMAPRGSAAAVKGGNANSSSHDQSYSPPFQSLGGGGGHHYQLQLPPSSDHHHGGGGNGSHGALNDFSNLALLNYSSIFDFNQHLDGGGGAGAAGSRDHGGDQCAAAGGVLIDLGLEEHYNYNSLMQM